VSAVCALLQVLQHEIVAPLLLRSFDDGYPPSPGWVGAYREAPFDGQSSGMSLLRPYGIQV
jgi:hypothetical protein